MRDHTGKVLIRFSKAVGVEDSNMLELLAIREALIVFISSPWVFSDGLIIESDSKFATNWVLNPALPTWKVRNFVNHIENLKSQVLEFRVMQIYREANRTTDALAKEGTDRETNLLWYDSG
ncbi:hypothetical protein PTKIN_Ptkin06aG0172600 [Pterospermum kingtungense]